MDSGLVSWLIPLIVAGSPRLAYPWEAVPMRFQDKVVVVTGAAGGIGLAAVRRFASEGAQILRLT